MLLERYGKLTMWKSKSSRLSYSLVESLPPLSMMNVRTLVRRHDRSFIVHLLEPAINLCLYGDLCNLGIVLYWYCISLYKSQDTVLLCQLCCYHFTDSRLVYLRCYLTSFHSVNPKSFDLRILLISY